MTGFLENERLPVPPGGLGPNWHGTELGYLCKEPMTPMEYLTIVHGGLTSWCDLPAGRAGRAAATTPANDR